MQESMALRAQIAQAIESHKHQQAELATYRTLLKEGFVSGRVSQLEAAVADYGVKLEERRSEAARAEQRLVDVDLRIKMLESDYRQQASDQLEITAMRLAELQEELRKLSDASARQVIVAPAAGDVMNLKFTAPGAVVPPGKPLLTSRTGRAEARDRGAYPHRGYKPDPSGAGRRDSLHRVQIPHHKMIEGKVMYVPADRSVDRATGLPYYVVLVEADKAALDEAHDIKLQAGMPARHPRGRAYSAAIPA